MNISLNFMKKIYQSPFFLLYLLIIINILVAYFFLKTPFIPGLGDSFTYYEAMRFFQGQPVDPVPYNRLLTSPLMLGFSIFFSYFTGGLYSGMAAVNIIFYAVFVYIIYKLILEIYTDEKVAFLGSILVLANFAMFTWGISFVVDMGGWFFFILATLFAVKYFKAENWPAGRRFYFFSVLSASIGVLFKEYGALGLISLVFLIAASKDAWPDKIKKIIGSGLLFLAIPALYHLSFYWRYHYSYFNWYVHNYYEYLGNPNPAGVTYNLPTLIKVLGWLFSVGWPIWLFGLWQEIKSNDKIRQRILLAILPASVTFLFWPSFTQRVAFIFVPWLAMIAGFGLAKIKNKYLIAAILAIYILANYYMDWLLKAVNLPF